MTMFVRPKDPAEEMWEGARTGVDGAIRWFGADEAFSTSELASRLKPILTQSNSSPVYLDLPRDVEIPAVTTSNRQSRAPLIDFFSKNNSQAADLVGLLRPSSEPERQKSDWESCLEALSHARPSESPSRKAGGSSKYRKFESLRIKLDQLKMIKSPAELSLLRKAADISAHGFKSALKLAAAQDNRSQKSEYHLVEAFEQSCRRATPTAAGRMGYVPVCAAGQAALTIHYTSNDRLLEPSAGHMVLLDAGYEYGGYVADITRTFPIGQGGKFTSAQRDLYEVVKSAQKQLISQCREFGRHSLSSLHRQSCELLKVGLLELGFDLDRNGRVLERLYPHYVGHPIGTDLHDTPTWSRALPLRAGSVITIEPGIYVPDEDQFPVHFRGVGIRIEDMVQINEEDQVILSVNTPKEVVDIETCAAGQLD